MAKLILSVDDQVIAPARRYATLQGFSVSAMAKTYLTAIAKPASPITVAVPILRSVRGVLKNADIDEYREHLAAKYQ